MNAPTRGADTSTVKIHVEWNTITTPQNGDAEVTSYSLEWDAGTGGAAWAALVGKHSNSLATTFTVTDGIQRSKVYQFRVVARNIWGWGAYSAVTSIKAAKIPFTMLAPTTSVDALTGGLQIDWVEPDTSGEPITEYLIEIQKNGEDTWIEYAATCGGADPSIFTCVVPMADLESATYGYAQGDPIYVRARSYNFYGESEISPTSIEGTQLRTTPQPMLAPTRNSETSGDKIVVDWSVLVAPDNGDSSILSYNLVWDDNTATVDQDLVGVSPYYTQT